MIMNGDIAIDWLNWFNMQIKIKYYLIKFILNNIVIMPNYLMIEYKDFAGKPEPYRDYFLHN